MLCLADQLQRAVERQEYSEAAHLLEAVQQLSLHFQSFAQIPKVAELGGRVSTLQKSLQMNVMREFELLGTGEESTNPLLLERLKACCLVTDALGYKVTASLCVLHGTLNVLHVVRHQAICSLLLRCLKPCLSCYCLAQIQRTMQRHQTMSA